METDDFSLQEKWVEVLQPFRVDETIARQVFADLIARYGEDGRYYHNGHHILNVLQAVESLQELATNYTAVRLAAWFHDVIYHMRPAATEASNEEKSADYAAEILRVMNIPTETVLLVHQLICATQLNYPTPNDPNFYVLLDADLATLAADCAQYDQYAQAIRREFAFVPDDLYRNGRSQILQSFLDRERIFLTDKMFNEKEANARLNIQRELDSLWS